MPRGSSHRQSRDESPKQGRDDRVLGGDRPRGKGVLAPPETVRGKRLPRILRPLPAPHRLAIRESRSWPQRFFEPSAADAPYPAGLKDAKLPGDQRLAG